ncbi:hypothetical protein SKAU_G00327060 [Synaphobranchus kaupii]|uniref:Uncharacterized protein n=1 Tax=Synaphobranchus kaupii TaxID=118154 RepID=A0A9Q1II86_SYNKA|nr:hypothetical protein SKAU_G00327060 [Synaphobranchus kaupii]
MISSAQRWQGGLVKQPIITLKEHLYSRERNRNKERYSEKLGLCSRHPAGDPVGIPSAPGPSLSQSGPLGIPSWAETNAPQSAVTALIDTGSTLSLIQTQLLLGPVPIQQKFLQANITDLCILGLDALASAGLTIDTARWLTLLQGRHLPQPTTSRPSGTVQHTAMDQRERLLQQGPAHQGTSYTAQQQYTRFLKKSTATVTGTSEEEQNEPTFDASYKIFCERIIRHRIIVNQEDKLKRRLTRDFTQLVFHSPNKCNICEMEMVFVETLSPDKLIDRLPHPSGTETTESTKPN